MDSWQVKYGRYDNMSFNNFDPKNFQPDVNAFMNNLRKDLTSIDYGAIERANSASYAKQGLDELRKQNIKLEDQKDLLIQNNEELHNTNQRLKEQNEILTNNNTELNDQVTNLRTELKQQSKTHYIREGIFVLITGILTWAITEHWDIIVSKLFEIIPK